MRPLKLATHAKLMSLKMGTRLESGNRVNCLIILEVLVPRFGGKLKPLRQFMLTSRVDQQRA